MSAVRGSVIEVLEPRRMLTPVVTTNDSPYGTYVANTGGTAYLTSLTLTDSGSTTLIGATVSLTANFVPGEDALTYTPAGNITGSYDTTMGTLTLSGSDTVSNYLTVLHSVMYQDTAANPDILVRRLTIAATDSIGTSDASYRHFTFISPLSNVETSTYSYYQSYSQVPMTSTLTVASGATLTGAVVRIDANDVPSEDVLTYTQVGNIAGSFNAATGTMTLSGADTAANYQSALRSVQYQDTNLTNPSAGIRRFLFAANNETGTLPVYRYFNVIAAPAVTIPDSIYGAYTANTAPAAMLTSLALTDGSSSTLNSATVALTDTFVWGEDVLSFTSIGNITGSYNTSTGTLTLTGTDTLAHYQTALQSVMYQDTNANPNVSTRRLTVNVNDGSGDCVTGYRHFAFVSPLSNLETTTYTYSAGAAATAITNNLTVASSATLTGAVVRIDANYIQYEDVLTFTPIGHIVGSFNAATGTMTLGGADTAANYQTALRSVEYQDTNLTHPTYNIRRFLFAANSETTTLPSYRYFNVVETPPTVATAAAANPSTVTGTQTALSVLGYDVNGESVLTYTWTTTGNLPGSVTFSPNMTNAAKNTTATFTTAGTYNFKVTISDPLGGSVTSSVTVTVNQTVTAIVVAPATKTLDETQTQQFSATASDQFGHAMSPQPTFAWTKNGVGSVNSTGLYAALTTTGSATVTATSGAIHGTAAVTVTAPPTVATPASANPNPATGTTTALSVLGADVNGESTLTYTWAGTPSATVTFGANGTNAAKNTTATFTTAGNYNVQVTITDPQGGSVTSSVSVVVNQTLTTITVTPAPNSLDEYQTQQFTATANDQFGHAMSAQPTITWSVTGIGSVNSSGLYTAPATTGSATVKATSGAINGTASVTVGVPTVATPAAATPNTVTGTTTALGVLGADVNGESTLTYTWATTGTPPATVTFGANGTNAAKNTTATFTQAGTYHFQVTISHGQASTTSSVPVTVNQTLTAIVVTPATKTLDETQTQQFLATASDQFGHAMSPQPTFNWTNNGVGSVNPSGLYTAPMTMGSATITATSGFIHATAAVTVTAPPTLATPASANPNPATGTTTALSVLGADVNGESVLTYTWTTTGNPPASVAFSPNGTNAAKNATATFTMAGSYNLKVTITDPQGVSVTSTVPVTVNQTFTAIAVSPNSVTLNEIQTQQFTATANDQFGNAMSAQPTITWSNTGIGSVNSSGLYTPPTATGTATVKATSGAISGTASVTVNDPAPTVATPASATPMTVTGTTTVLSVLGADYRGESLLTYTWAGTPSATVAFSANGTNLAKNTTATFTMAGSYSFQVTITDPQGVSATSTVSVTVNQTLTAIVVTPATKTLDETQSQQFAATANDQFGHAMTAQPTFTWTNSGVGLVNSTGLYAAPTSATGSATVTATSGAVQGTAVVTVTAPPTVATPASANPNPATGTTTALSVLGADVNGESVLTYFWATTGTPPASVAFSPNGTNAAKNSTATFTMAGSYNLQVTITDPQGGSVTSTVPVTVNQTFTTIAVTPNSATLYETQTQQFTATANDQFGASMAAQPQFTWSNTGIGLVNSSGLYTAPSVTGTAAVQASSGGINGSAAITVGVLATLLVTHEGVPLANNGMLDFAQTPTNQSITDNLVLTNTGLTSLTINSVTATAGFTVINPPTIPLAPNASVTMGISFSDSTSETKSGTLTIASTDANSPYTLQLRGTAASPDKTYYIDTSPTQSAGTFSFTNGNFTSLPYGFHASGSSGTEYISTSNGSSRTAATWTSNPGVVLPGLYRVSATWSLQDNNVLSGASLAYAPYTIFVNGAAQDTVVMQQSNAPTDLVETANGQVVGWNQLGIVRVGLSQQISVELDAPPGMSNEVIASAIRLEQLDPAAMSVSLPVGVNTTDVNVIANDAQFPAIQTGGPGGATEWTVQLTDSNSNPVNSLTTLNGGTASLNPDGSIHFAFNGNTETQDEFWYRLVYGSQSSTISTPIAKVIVTRVATTSAIYTPESLATNYSNPLTFDVRPTDALGDTYNPTPVFTGVRNGAIAPYTGTLGSTVASQWNVYDNGFYAPAHGSMPSWTLNWSLDGLAQTAITGTSDQIASQVASAMGLSTGFRWRNGATSAQSGYDYVQFDALDQSVPMTHSFLITSVSGASVTQGLRGTLSISNANSGNGPGVATYTPNPVWFTDMAGPESGKSVGVQVSWGSYTEVLTYNYGPGTTVNDQQGRVAIP